MTPEAFRQQIADLTRQLAGRERDAALDDWLNREHGAASATYRALKASCEAGVAEGWLCNREGGGIRYGRIFKPADDLHGFSVDVVDMRDIAGPHHSHPLGEIDLIMPIEGEARFDGRPAGWLVCPPGSAHRRRWARAARWCSTCCRRARSCYALVPCSRRSRIRSP
jgi:hypothetical protein